MSSEEEIALSQLDRLREIARDRLLSLEEIKIFDLLVKNLRISQEKTETIIPIQSKPALLSDQEMIEIASGFPKLEDKHDPETK